MRNPLKSDHLLSMVSAAIIWIIHFLLSYGIVSLACAYGYARSRLLGLNSVMLGIGFTTVVALILLIYTAAINYRKWRHELNLSASDISPSPFIALNSMLLCGLSIIAVLWVALPSLMLPPCAT
ncbi:hypothetical protein [Nitrosococcus wardiae]|uniref:Uncharacterized protein n=1 Tax=Nitrosococcus wardiae TaxID=1814290 RepID=A0A4P7C1Z5_9GAMM|nr:hypothetical protein [Nitrosococcus wardiae]QBQ55719.1 hypothetical protein E3U44_15275 [Nitrosococcus wardiae]